MRKNKMWNKAKWRTICLTTDNFQKLASLGTVPESLNAIVGRLLEEHYEELKRKNNFAGEVAIIQK